MGEHLKTERFYQSYWSLSGSAIPEKDHTIEARKRLLAGGLRRLEPDRSSASRVLDAGCGSGEFTQFIRDLGYDVEGIDIAQSAIDRARSRFSDLRFSVGSLEQGLPFSDSVFDAVWSTEVLEHLFDVHAGLAEMNRVLRPGGLLLLTTPYHGRFKNLLIALGDFEKHYNPYISHIRFFTKRSLTKCLDRAGFSLVSCKGIGRQWPVFMSMFLVAHKTGVPGPPPQIMG